MIFRLALPLAALCILIALLAGCSSVEVNANTVPGADLSKHSTYSWKPLTHTTSETRINPSSPTHVELKRLIDKELTDSGLAAAPAGESDLTVKYGVARLDSYSRTVVTDEEPYGRYSTSIRPEARVTAFEQGSLLVDINDASTGKLLWRGTAKTPLYEESGPVRDQAKLQHVVRELFADFRR